MKLSNCILYKIQPFGFSGLENDDRNCAGTAHLSVYDLGDTLPNRKYSFDDTLPYIIDLSVPCAEVPMSVNCSFLCPLKCFLCLLSIHFPKHP